MKRIVVTGATSMIGLALIDCALKNNVEVLALIRPNSQKKSRIPQNRLITVIECNFDDLKNTNLSGIENGFDCFYHFAWNAEKNARNNAELQEINIKNTIEVIKIANLLKCRKFVGAGSQAEYGRVEGKLSHLTPIHPDIAYGIAKYAAGQLAYLKCKELFIDFNWVRILSVYGIYDNPNTMISYAINEHLAGRIPEFTKCEQNWDYLFSEDAGRAFYLIGENGKPGKFYCLGSGIARPLSDYVKEINKNFNKPECSGIGIKEYAPQQVMNLCADISELIADTGFKPLVSFEEGVKKTINYWKSI